MFEHFLVIITYVKIIHADIYISVAARSILLIKMESSQE